MSKEKRDMAQNPGIADLTDDEQPEAAEPTPTPKDPEIEPRSPGIADIDEDGEPILSSDEYAEDEDQADDADTGIADGTEQVVVEDGHADDDQPPEEAADADPFREYLLDQAVDFGFSREEAAGLGPQLAAVLRRVSAMAQAGAQQPQQQAQKQQPQPEPEPDLLAALELSEFADEDVGKVVEAVRGTVKPLLARIAELETRTQGYERADREQRVREFETAVAALPEPYKEVFGTGSKLDGTLDQTHQQARLELLDAMGLLSSGYGATGKDVSEKELMQQALRLRFPNIEIKKATGDVVKTAKGRNGQIMQRPTHRKGRPLTPRERAIKAVEEQLRDKSLGVRGEPETLENDFIPILQPR